MNPSNITSKDVPKKSIRLVILYAPVYPLERLGLSKDFPIAQPMVLSKKEAQDLSQKLTEEISFLKSVEKVAKEFELTKTRKKLLLETITAVESLRETDRTSSGGLASLKEKLGLLQEEIERLDLIFIELVSALKNITVDNEQRLGTLIQESFNEITLVETDSWEPELDALRSRFLMQKEDELLEELQAGSDKDSDLQDLITDHKLMSDGAPEKTLYQIEIYLPRKKRDVVRRPLQEFNALQKSLLAVDSSLDLFNKSESDLAQIQKEQEQENFKIGKKAFALKREQGILSMKVYEVILTLRTRLINISGSIASRKFLKDALNEMLSITEQSLPFSEKKDLLIETVVRLRRIIGKVAPGEMS